ncbi:sensor histidine kinase [Microbacterium sp. CJ77]|nr:histidine kinase [Microbacterium sp. CJ77]
MTIVASHEGRRWALFKRRSRSTAIFVIGLLLDMVCVMNVPGSAEFLPASESSPKLTTQGTLLVLLAAACWATVFYRDRAPIVVAIAGGILLMVGTSYVLALIGAYRLLLRYPQRTVLISTVTTLAVAFFVGREMLTGWGHAFPWLLARDGVGNDPKWGITSMTVAVFSLGVTAALVAYRRARVEASLSRVRVEQLHERADALGEQLARQSERERIARDLHDALGHRLSSMALAAGAFESQAAGAPIDPALAEWARLVRRQAHAALEDVRGVVGGLRLEQGETFARPVSMRMVGQLLADLRSAGQQIEAYVVVESIERVDPLRDAAAFRVLQEALTNAMKHATGSTISVTVDAAPERGIRVRVINALVLSTSHSSSGRVGIAGIRERAAAVGGTAWIGPHEGHFLVDVSLPWQ